MRPLLLCLTFILSAPVYATTQEYTQKFAFHDVVFEDGGTAYGTFVYDFLTQTGIEVNVTTTPGTSRDTTVTYTHHAKYGLTGQGHFLGNYGSMMLTTQAPPATWDEPTYLDWWGLTFDQSLSYALDGGRTYVTGVNSYTPGTYKEGGCTFSDQHGYVGCTSGYDSYRREAISGYVTAVPVPAAFWLFGTALLMGGLIRKAPALSGAFHLFSTVSR